jgi:hypothetical protein
VIPVLDEKLWDQHHSFTSSHWWRRRKLRFKIQQKQLACYQRSRPAFPATNSQFPHRYPPYGGELARCGQIVPICIGIKPLWYGQLEQSSSSWKP